MNSKVLCRCLFIVLSASLLLLNISCTTVASNRYDKFLIKSEKNLENIKIDLPFSYELSERTQNHSAIIKDWKAGAFNKYKYEFATVIEATMKSEEWNSKFSKTDKKKGVLLKFDLESFKFEKNGSEVVLGVIAQYGSENILKKTYKAQGVKQGGKMFWGGGFAMKDAIQTSTKTAMDTILSDLLKDLSKSVEK